MFHGCRVHPSDSEIQIDATKHFEAWRLLAREERQPSRGIVVVLEDDSAHPLRARQLGDLDSVDGPGHVVWSGMHMNVDRSVQQSSCIPCWRTLAARGHERYRSSEAR